MTGASEGSFSDAESLRILIIDNDLATRRLLQKQLGLQGFAVTSMGSGPESHEALADKPDLIIAAAELPGFSEIDILRLARRHSMHTAVILVAATYNENVIVNALDNGADDYITKPFGMGEFLARVRTALRHRLRRASEMPVFETGALAVDTGRRIVTVDGKRIKLTPKEYELLHMLAQSHGQVVTCAYLMKRLWTEETTQSYLRVLVRAVRKKIEPVPEQPIYIHTVAAAGYFLQSPGSISPGAACGGTSREFGTGD